MFYLIHISVLLGYCRRSTKILFFEYFLFVFPFVGSFTLYLYNIYNFDVIKLNQYKLIIPLIIVIICKCNDIIYLYYVF